MKLGYVTVKTNRSYNSVNMIFLKKAVSVIRLRQFDISTAEGRSQERYRRAGLTALAATLTKGVTILTMLVSVPLTLHYLGSERYGLWMTISSMVLMVGFADLGMGLGLMNAVSEAHGRDDRQAAANYVSSGFFMLLSIGTLLALLFLLAYPYIPWPRVFNVNSTGAAREAGPAMAVFFLCFAANLPLGVVHRVQRGYQEGYINSGWESLGKILSLLGLLLVIYFKAGLFWLVLAIAGTPLLAAVGNGVVLFWRNKPWLRPRWHSFTRESAKKIARLGLLFFVMQFTAALSYQSHNFILAQMLGPEAVTQYAVPARLFLLLPMLFSFVLEALWPACGEAIARGEIVWVKRTFYRTVFLGLLICLPITTILVIIGPKIIHLWVGKNINPSFTLLLGLGGWAVISVTYGSYAMLFNASNAMKFQIICALVMIGISLPLSIALVYLIGIPGVIFGTIISYCLCVVIPSIFFAKYLFIKMYLHSSLNLK